jgi:glycosyltransferase involved in cell wall biosynthesis
VLLDGSFPQPDTAALAHAEAAVQALDDGALVVADGLAFGAMPELAERHARRLRWVALVHHPLALETGLEEGRRRALFESERRALGTACAVIATSRATARALTEFDVPAGRLHVVEPGCDPAPLATGSQGGTPALLCVATLIPRKGHVLLVEALAGLKDRAWTLKCAGSSTRDPATTAALRQAIAAAGLDGRVDLLGEVDPSRLDALYAQADLFVLPSFHEGYGMALAEALARGVPVFSTRAGAIVDTVPADAGVLLPAGDALAWRSALASWLDRPAWRRELAAGARAARTRLPSWPQACERFAAALAAVG